MQGTREKLPKVPDVRGRVVSVDDEKVPYLSLTSPLSVGQHTDALI